jgi:hypothetical protein
MHWVFPASRIQTMERGFDPAKPGLTEFKDAGSFLAVEQDAEELIESKLGERFGVSTFFLMNLTRDPQAWAAVFFTGIVEDSDQLLASRAELADDLRFAAYGAAFPGMTNPPLGAMVIRSASSLSKASKRHPVFERTWEVLKPCSPEKNWVAVIDL